MGFTGAIRPNAVNQIGFLDVIGRVGRSSPAVQQSIPPILLRSDSLVPFVRYATPPGPPPFPGNLYDEAGMLLWGEGGDIHVIADPPHEVVIHNMTGTSLESDSIIPLDPDHTSIPDGYIRLLPDFWVMATVNDETSPNGETVVGLMAMRAGSIA